VRWLDDSGIRNKAYTTLAGRPRGGKDFDKSTLALLLRNPLYLGKITYKGQMYEGEHDAIVDEDLFGQVQGLLRRNRNTGGKHHRNKHRALLKGLVRCKHCGCAMGHHFATRGKRRYRYYVCQRAQKKGWSACPAPSLPAEELEDFVVGQVRRICRTPTLLREVVGRGRELIAQEVEAIKAERKEHQARARQLNGRLCELAAVQMKPGVANEMASVQQALEGVRQEIEQVNSRIASAQLRLVQEDELVGAGESFGPVWKNLKTKEKERLIRLLIQTIEYDAGNEAITITYHPGVAEGVEFENANANN